LVSLPPAEIAKMSPALFGGAPIFPQEMIVPSFRKAKLESPLAEILVTIIPGDVSETPQPTPRPAGLAKRDWKEKIAAIAHEYACAGLEEIPLFFIRKPTLIHWVSVSEFVAKKQVKFASIVGVRPKVHGYASLENGTLWQEAKAPVVPKVRQRAE